MNLLKKFKVGLSRTRELTIGKLSNLLLKKDLDEDTIEELEEALLEADLGVDTVDELVEKLQQDWKNRNKKEDVSPKELLKSTLKSILDKAETQQVNRFSAKPWVIVLVGVNGSGKTTTAGKLAHKFKQMGKTTAIAAADTFRVAAIEQVGIWVKIGGARLISQKSGSDPAAVAFDALKSVYSKGEDVLIIDTAGRLQGSHNLMQELSKIVRVLKKLDNSAPHEVLLVIDSTTGQNGLSQAHGFKESANVSGLVITKLDGTSKGGIVIPVVRDLNLPVEYIGLGEKSDDLMNFEMETYIDALFER